MLRSIGLSHRLSSGGRCVRFLHSLNIYTSSPSNRTSRSNSSSSCSAFSGANEHTMHCCRDFSNSSGNSSSSISISANPNLLSDSQINWKYHPSIIRAVKYYYELSSSAAAAKRDTLHQRSADNGITSTIGNKGIDKISDQESVYMLSSVPGALEELHTLTLKCAALSFKVSQRQRRDLILNNIPIGDIEQLLKRAGDDEKMFRCIVAMLAMGIPHDAVLWRMVDCVMEQHLNVYGEDFGFFCCHILGLASEASSMQLRTSKTHMTLLYLILSNNTREQQQQQQVQQVQIQENSNTSGTDAAEYAIEQLALRMRFMSWGAKHIKSLHGNGDNHSGSSVTVGAKTSGASQRNTAYFQLLGGGLNMSFGGSSNSSNSYGNNSGGGAAMSQKAFDVLSLTHEPVSLHALSDLWLQSPKLNLNNTYRFYKSLYEKVLQTVVNEPVQLTRNNDPVGIVTSLLEAMVSSKHKYSKLEHEVLRLLSGVPSSQSEYDQYGIRLFSACIKLDNIPVALSILQNVLNNSSGLEYAFAKLHQTSGANGPVLSDKAKENIYNYLSSPSTRRRDADPVPSPCSSGQGDGIYNSYNKASLVATPEYQLEQQRQKQEEESCSFSPGTIIRNSPPTAGSTAAADDDGIPVAIVGASPSLLRGGYTWRHLVLGLLSFHEDGKHAQHKLFTLLEAIEADVLSSEAMNSLSISDALSLMYTYAFVGRSHPKVLQHFDELLLRNKYKDMDDKQLSLLLWVCAKLNHAVAPYIQDNTAADAYFNSISLNFNSAAVTAEDMISSGIDDDDDIEVVMDGHRGENDGGYISSSSSSNNSKNNGIRPPTGIISRGWRVQQQRQVSQVAKVLWSLAVLEKLDFTAHARYANFAVQASKSLPQKQAFRHVRLMLTQVLTEMRIKLEQQQQQCQKHDMLLLQHMERQLGTAYNNNNNNNNNKSSNGTFSTQREGRQQGGGGGGAARQLQQWQELHNINSSFTHKEASLLLQEMGVSHTNEYVIKDGIVVDCYIPPSREAMLAEGSNAKGTVIEFDGPSHFETYLRVSSEKYLNTAQILHSVHNCTKDRNHHCVLLRLERVDSLNAALKPMLSSIRHY